MAKCYCPCGTAYDVPEASLGKKAKCRKCGAVFTLKEEKEESGIFAIADEAWPDTDPDAGRTGAGVAASSAPGSAADGGAPANAASRPVDTPMSEVPSHEKRGYSADVLWTFLFPSSVGNLMSFVAIWLVMSFAPLLTMCGIVGLIVAVLVAGWYAAFQFNVLRSAAAGETNLADVGFSRDLVDDIVIPLIAWIGSWVVVLLPAFVFLMVSLSSGTTLATDVWELAAGGLGGIWQGNSGAPTAFFVLVGLGIAAWPMIILCVALGGFTSFFRVDLIGLTIIKTLPAYLLTLLLVFGATALDVALRELVSTSNAPAAGASVKSAIGSGIVIQVASTGIGVYADIVVMRLIGLYYHHFKGRFAWSWG